MDDESMPSDSIVVALLGADALALAGLEALLEREGIDVVVDAGEVADVIVADVGWETAAIFDDATVGIPVVAIAADVPSALAAWRAGVSGLLYRDASSGELAAAVRAVSTGLVVLQGRVAADLLPSVGPPPVEPLTAREQEVLEQMARGLSNREIARALGIRESTAKFHVNAVMGKLGAASRTEAVVAAARSGLVAL